jgi:hypothetical protein
MRSSAAVVCLLLPWSPPLSWTVCPPAAPEASLVFGVAAGTRVQKTFDYRGHLALTAWEVTVDGGDVLGEATMEYEIAVHQELEFVDEYRAMDGALPTLLSRELRRLDEEAVTRTQVEGQDTEESVDSSSELEGRTVLFTYDPEAGRHTVQFAEQPSPAAELLAELVEDSDVRLLLPAGAVAVDEGWTIDPARLDEVLEPGGNLQLIEEGEVGDYEPGHFFTAYGGACRGTYLGRREIDGAELAVIGLELELTHEEQSTGVDEDGDPTLDQTTLRFELTGELHWHPRELRPVALQLDGALTTTTSQQVHWHDDLGDHELRESTTLGGEVSFRYRWTLLE